jgi:pimeloyl-ACP methyl ester carboxylesterase
MSFSSPSSSTSASVSNQSKPSKAIKFAKQAQKLSLGGKNEEEREENAAIAGRFITPHDAIIETAEGDRLPAVPVEEAQKLNRLRDEAISDNRDTLPSSEQSICGENEKQDGAITAETMRTGIQSPEGHGGPLDVAKPPAHTHPLFPPLPLYGPPSFLRTLQCQTFRAVSFCLSLSFLSVLVVGSCVNGIGVGLRCLVLRVKGQNLEFERPFYKEEMERESTRQEAATRWKRRQRKIRTEKIEPIPGQGSGQADEDPESDLEFPPLEGGDDPVICDIAYYARRVGLDVETFKVQTEDGFILTLWHIYNPREYTPLSETERSFRKPEVFHEKKANDFPSSNRRYPVLLIHGLLQSAGAYCANDDDSLAFFLCKAGYDVWLGNNRCGFESQHATLKYNDPRMWCWNIRHMGVLDLPAFVSRVLYETGFETLGLICHSQGTTEAMVALADDQRPELGQHISVFCGLAPAAYAGPLIKKAYFRFMRMISPNAFRIFFGIHAFVPFMMTMHSLLPSRLYGALGYSIFSYLFDWSDKRWDRGLRNRMFQFSPVYVSSESMRWWLGRDGFAVQKCILATEEQGLREEEEDRAFEDNNRIAAVKTNTGLSSPDADDDSPSPGATDAHHHHRKANAWYGPKTPPFALWIAGSDDLVDGRKLLRRIRNGREPYVNLVHHKIIDEYEHLDVLWAMDAIEQVGKEVADVVWRTAPEDAKSSCRVPRF